MVTTLQATTPAQARSDGLRGDQMRLDPPGRRARLPEMAVGAAMVIGFSLAAVLWHMSATHKEPALALARAVGRGEVIEAADLRVTYIASDDRIARLGRDDASAVVGRMTLSDLPAGTLLTRGSVAPRASVGAGEGVVGLALEPGQVPAPELLPGDVVNVVAGPPEGAGAAEADATQSTLLATAAEVYAVEELGTQGRTFVSLKLPEPVANRVAAAAQRGPVRLVLVGR